MNPPPSNMPADGKTYAVEGDGYDVKINQGKYNGGDKLTSEMKFDKYFMYGIDSMGARGNNAPECGPGMANGAQCRGGSNGQKSCCAHVVMNEGDGRETSIYRCMNQQVVDASFSM